MSFLDALAQRQLLPLLQGNKFVKIKPRNVERVDKLMQKIITENLYVRIEQDCDPDGFCSGAILQATLERLGHTRYDICRHFTKRHVLSIEYANMLIQERFDVVFLLDSSTNSLDVIRHLTAAGIIVAIIDHHTPDYGWSDYPENSFLVNPQMEIKEPAFSYPELGPILKLWASQNKAIFVKESNYHNPTLTRDAVVGIFKQLEYYNFDIGEQVDERCDCVLLLDPRDTYRSSVKELLVLGTPQLTAGDGLVTLMPVSQPNEKAKLYCDLSCGALCALVCDYILCKAGHKENQDLYIYGYITLYSDISNLDNAYNVAYLRQFRDDSIHLPKIVRMFMTQWDTLNRSFVSYKFAPRLNALVRLDKYDILHALFYENPTEQVQIDYLLAQTENAYAKSKELAAELREQAIIREYKDIVVAYIPPDAHALARNFTGLVASIIGGETNAITMCLMKESESNYGGSVRDPFGRDILSTFKHLCSCGGHGPAFGVSIPTTEVQMICTEIQGCFDNSHQDIITVDWTETDSLENIRRDVNVMAEYNEYGGQGLPSAYGIVLLPPDTKIFKETKRTVVYWRGLKFIVFASAVAAGDTLIVAPTVRGATVELLVKNVGYGQT